MKSFRIVLFAVVVVLVSACGKKAEKAADYNDAIIRRQLAIIKAFEVMDSTFKDSMANKEQIDYAYVNLRARVKEGMLSLDSVGSFQKDPSLQLAAKELFNVYHDLVEDEYKKLTDIKLLPEDQVTMALADTSTVVTRRIHDLSKEAQDKFIRSQEEFGKKYNLIFE